MSGVPSGARSLLGLVGGIVRNQDRSASSRLGAESNRLLLLGGLDGLESDGLAGFRFESNGRRFGDDFCSSFKSDVLPWP